MSKIQLRFFHDPRLSDYRFSINEADYEEIDETSSGYDAQGQEWRGIDLSNLRRQGKIIKQFHGKTVFLRETVALLGSIRECPDGSWMAHSCYFDTTMDYVEVYGFSEEFQAIKYLHEVMMRSFPNNPSLVLNQQQESNDQSSFGIRIIYLKSLNAPLGYIQVSKDTLWMSCSFYHPKNMSEMKVFGFSNDFFAVRYLFQVAEAFFPESIQEITKLA